MTAAGERASHPREHIGRVYCRVFTGSATAQVSRQLGSPPALTRYADDSRPQRLSQPWESPCPLGLSDDSGHCGAGSTQFASGPFGVLMRVPRPSPPLDSWTPSPGLGNSRTSWTLVRGARSLLEGCVQSRGCCHQAGARAESSRAVPSFCRASCLKTWDHV